VTAVSEPWRTVSVVGVGLIGGSFALGLRKEGFTGKIIGVSSPRTTNAALERKVIDEALPLADAAEQSDLIFLAQPIHKILTTLDTIDEAARPGALITDAGSTKRAIVDKAAQKIKRARFVGGHPMAGKESRGVEEADPDLFRDYPWILMTEEPRLESWIGKLGSNLVRMDAATHDRLVALSSHLPQLMSTALGTLFAETPEIASVAGPTARGMARLALSDYEIWRDIFSTNAREVDHALASYIERLQQLRDQLRKGTGLAEAFELASKGARAVRR